MIRSTRLEVHFFAFVDASSDHVDILFVVIRRLSEEKDDWIKDETLKFIEIAWINETKQINLDFFAFSCHR